MGQFFSLRGAAEWEEAATKVGVPSVWSNVTYTPLSRDHQVLLDRTGGVQYSFPSGIRQGGELLQLSDVSNLSLLACFDELLGHFYCGVLLHCPLDNARHGLRRHVDEVVLKPGAVQIPKKSSGSPTGRESFELSFNSVMCDDGESMNEFQYSYLLLYTIKEGVLAHFSNDASECEDVIRGIAASYTSGPGGGRRKAGSEAEAPAVPPQIKTLNHPVGRCAPPVSRVIGEAIVSDLKRTFVISREPEEQAGITNCVAFSIRLLAAVQLSVRGYDIQRACENCPDLGRKAGEAAATAWEHLLRIVP